MRSQILQILRSQPDHYVSGEMVSQRLSVSRTAVWKQIQALRLDGYEIESHSRRGYCLRYIPDLLLPEEVLANLQTSWLGQEIHYFDCVASTNNEAKRLAAANKPAGTIVIAEEQQSGRGRLSRTWFSPRTAGIWLSVILRPPFLPQDAPKLTLLAAVAANQAIRNVTGLETGIKWPNDIVYQGCKIAGILTEMNAEMDAINHVIIGIGINVNLQQPDFPSEIAESATSLRILTGTPIVRVKLLVDILVHLERRYEEACDQGFSEVFAEWSRMAVTLGKMVEVTSGEQQFTGRADSIDDTGALLVDTIAGRRRVIAGDVKVRPMIAGGL